jgi:hypothetical protein
MDPTKVKAFAEELGLKLVKQAPQIVADIEKDKADASTETRTQLAAQALVQLSDVAQSIDPNDAEAFKAFTAMAVMAVTALKAPSPVQAPSS